MCNFHEAVALVAAADPVTGLVHPGRKAVIRVALSRYWAERYVDGAEDVNGYNPYPLATRAQQDAFEKSGLRRTPEQIRAAQEDGIAFLREKIALLEKTHDLSASALRLPVVTAREAFMDMAIAAIYEGDPKGVFTIAPDVARDDLKPLHRAVSSLHEDARTREVLENLVKAQVCTLYTEAPSKVSRKVLDTFEKLPERVKAVSARLARYGGNIALGGFAGIAGHGVHYGSVLGAGMASGTASSYNLALSGVFLAASYGGWTKFFGGQYRPGKEKLRAFAVQAGLTVGIALGVQSFLPHDHMHGERAEWFASLPPVLKDDFMRSSRQTYDSLPADLRTRLDEKARGEGIAPEIFLLTCSGEDQVSRDIAAYLSSRPDAPSARLQ